MADNVKQMVEYVYPGIIVSESSSKQMSQRDPREAVIMAPESSYAFRFYEVTKALDLGADFKVTPVARNHSAWHYIDGQIFTVADVEARQDPSDEILISNMKCNGYDRVVKCRTGNWVPMSEGDVVVGG